MPARTPAVATMLARAARDRLRGGADRTAHDLDPDELAAGLGWPPGSVARIEVLGEQHGTSLRGRVRVHRDDGGSVLLFVKNTPRRAGARALDAAARLCEREVHFYRHLAPSVAGAPDAVLAQWDPRTGRSTVALRDLGDEGFEFRSAAEPCTAEEVALALSCLAQVHAAQHGARGTLDAPIYRTDGPGARRAAVVAAWATGRPPKHVAEILPSPVLRASAVLRRRCRDYPHALTSFPQTFIHNDTHRGNLAFSADRARLVDWQLCGNGPGLKDVAYLMATALEPDERRAHERALLAHYDDRLRAAGGQPHSASDTWFAYRVLSVTGYVAAAVTAMFRDRLQAAANAEESLRRAATAVDDLDSFAALTELLDRTRTVS